VSSDTFAIVHQSCMRSLFVIVESTDKPILPSFQLSAPILIISQELRTPAALFTSRTSSS
jgi:hypothetical protein